MLPHFLHVLIPLLHTTHTVSTIKRYATANFSNITDAVNVWHTTLGRPDADLRVELKSTPSSSLPLYDLVNIMKIVRIAFLETFKIGILQLYQF
jgi:hypothetical protein